MDLAAADKKTTQLSHTVSSARCAGQITPQSQGNPIVSLPPSFENES